VINALRNKKVCTVAPIPGETKIWQYVTLMKRVFLIDSPGVVYDTGDSDHQIVLKGVVRPEKLDAPDVYIQHILDRVKPAHMKAIYGIVEWNNAEDFLEKLARRGGRLLKGGEPDICISARSVLVDWQRGKIPYYTSPPVIDGDFPPKEKPKKSKSDKKGNIEPEVDQPLAGRIGTSTFYEDEEEPEEFAMLDDDENDIEHEEEINREELDGERNEANYNDARSRKRKREDKRAKKFLSTNETIEHDLEDFET
jgi:nuclear GTP-binding protein